MKTLTPIQRADLIKDLAKYLSAGYNRLHPSEPKQWDNFLLIAEASLTFIQNRTLAEEEVQERINDNNANPNRGFARG